MVKTQGKNRLYWDLLIILCSVYQAIFVLLEICLALDYFGSPEIRTTNSVIDLIFIMDIVLRFRTTYIDPISGEEVMDSMLISMKYLKSYSFYIDVISTVPFADLLD